jgi:RNA polymerase sigma-70 factor (ECF subfamily)
LDSTATPNKNIQTEEYNMTTINLRELYPWYTEDTFIEVSDEVAAFLEEDKRLQVNYTQYIRDNRAFYSLDAGDGIEAEALNLPEQPDEALERMELERLLKEALAQLTPAQRRRVLAYIVGGLSQLQIAARENTTQPAVHHSVRKGLSHLKRILKNFD